MSHYTLTSHCTPTPEHDMLSPAWASFANALIDRLAQHHNTEPRARTRRREGPPSELDQLLEAFNNQPGADKPTAPTGQPSRQVPARQVLTAIRLAATSVSEAVLRPTLQDGALTVLTGIEAADLVIVTDVLAIAFPHRQWRIIAPDVTDGVLAKGAAPRFERAIIDSLDLIKPVIVLQPAGLALPPVLRALAPTTFTLAPISRATIAHQLAAGSLSLQLPPRSALHEALPSDAALARLTTGAACAGLRAPTLDDAIANLHRLTDQGSCAQGPRLEDLTGDSAALQAARRMVADLQDWRAGRVAWDEISHSLLLHGAPGTGKSWLAQAMGNSAGLSVVKATFGEWQAAGHLGQMLRAMRQTFAEARQQAPCLLIIDEIDAVGARADADHHARHYRTQVVSAFLTEMDQIAHEPGVIVIGTANHPDRMDPAVLRAGRMDLKIAVPLPDADQLLAALQQKLRVPRNNGAQQLAQQIEAVALQQLARQAVGVSFADLDAAIRAAKSDARHGDAPLTAAMIATHLGISLEGEDHAYLWRIAVHEAGHAIMAAALRLGPIERMMIAADGGQIGRRVRPSQTRLADIEAEITYALAGRAAELLLLGEASAGAGGPASSDLAIATRHAIRIEVAYGLGYEGTVWHADPEAVHLATLAIRDRVRQRLQQAGRRASEILQQHRQTLNDLAEALLEQRSMNKTAIAAWLDPISASQDNPCHNQRGKHDEEQLLMEG